MATLTPLSTDTSVRLRLARIEGQAAGLRRMWDAQRPAEELLDQIAAVRAALRGTALEIVHDTAVTRLRDAPATVTPHDPPVHADLRARLRAGLLAIWAGVTGAAPHVLHLGPVRVTLFGIVVALALLVGITVIRRRYEAAGGDGPRFLTYCARRHTRGRGRPAIGMGTFASGIRRKRGGRWRRGKER